jgi:hypothetical protein
MTQPDSFQKSLTTDQITAAAQRYHLDPLALRAVIEVECRGHGFESSGEPTILFERHVFYQRLSAEHKLAIQLKAAYLRPDLCNPVAGGYGLEAAQHNRLQAACLFDRTAALESASWGIGQVMGYHWQALGYASLQAFINAMYRDEASQLDAMLRYIQMNHLTSALNQHDWRGFALKYNGAGFSKNSYDVKLATCYNALMKAS